MTLGQVLLQHPFEAAMELRFYVDPETGEPHIYNHAVTEGEVRQVVGPRGHEEPRAVSCRHAAAAAGRGPCGGHRDRAGSSVSRRRLS